MTIPPTLQREPSTRKSESITTTELPSLQAAERLTNPIHRRTALVKLQGPFTDIQLDSIARGLVYLEKLGLVCVIVVENDKHLRGEERERSVVIEETMRVVTALEKHGARARPVLGAVVRLGPKSGEDESKNVWAPEAHTLPFDLTPIRSALRANEIPVLPPFALDSICRSVRIDANDVVAGLVRGMIEFAESAAESSTRDPNEIDMMPMRLMIISREGGVPSYARGGLPHLLINLDAEYDHIQETFQPAWQETNPSALSNLALARTCLEYMPRSSSATMVSHRSPSSLIANLITNKPAVSSSLPHALLQGHSKLTASTPTLLRRGLPIRVIRTIDEIDKFKMRQLLESAFKRTLDESAFYERLKTSLDFVIIAGDYAGTAIVTNEARADGQPPLSYLDKFAVLPNHQGDGTVDFLWVALHDETYGLGTPFAINANGGKLGKGEGRDLVWRSRSDNPVNKWYFERSDGHFKSGSWVMFWCDAEKKIRTEGQLRGHPLHHLERWERGRLSAWAETVFKIESSWEPLP